MVTAAALIWKKRTSTPTVGVVVLLPVPQISRSKVKMKLFRLIKLGFLGLLLALLLSSLETTIIEAQSFDICLQDDSNSAVMLRFNSTTGDYQFCTGSVFTGKGSVTRSGSVITLQNAAADRR